MLSKYNEELIFPYSLQISLSSILLSISNKLNKANSKQIRKSYTFVGVGYNLLLLFIFHLNKISPNHIRNLISIVIKKLY